MGAGCPVLGLQSSHLWTFNLYCGGSTDFFGTARNPIDDDDDERRADFLAV